MRVAAVDCGTNSVRLLVADVSGDPLVSLTRRMEIVRLGEGSDRTGRIGPAALERARAVLADYAAEIARLGATRVRMCATSASRDASNADEFTAMVRDVLGVDPEVISGEQEARLSFEGAVRGLRGAAAPYLVVDIGGGSTEFVVGTDVAEAAVSVDVGCVRMTERHLADDPPTRGQVGAAEADITAAVDRALAAVGGAAAATLVGLAGSVTTLAAITLGLTAYDSERIHGTRMSYDTVAKLTGDLLAMPTAGRLEIPAMHPGRADVIAAGALVLRIVMERAGAGSVVASEHDILDGIAYRLAS